MPFLKYLNLFFLNNFVGVKKGYITLFNLPNTLISLNRHILGLYCNYRGVLIKLIAVKVGASVMYNQIGGIKISIKPINIKSLLSGFCRYIF